MYKLIIAEDEDLIREGLAESINSGNFGFQVVGQAEDGEKALELVKQTNPEVIITDIAMPKLNGLALIERVREISPETKVIIISGYDDFAYAQKALRIGVKDYLLKPFLPQQIREVLKKTAQDIEKQKNSYLNLEALKKQISDSLPIVRERFLKEVLEGEMSNAEVEEKLKRFGMEAFGYYFAIVILKAKPVEAVKQGEENENMLQYFIMDTVNKLLDSTIKVHVLSSTGHESVLLVYINDNPVEMAFATMNKRISRMVTRLQKYSNSIAYAATGNLYSSISDLKKSYDQARETLNYNFSRKNGAVANYRDISLMKNMSYKRPAQLEEQLLLNVKLCEDQKCMDNIESLFGLFEANPTQDLRRVKMNIFELVTSLFGDIEVSEASRNEVLSSKQISVYEEVRQCEDIIELKHWFVTFVQTYMKELEKMRASRSVSLVEKVKELADIYIRDEKFSLDDVVSKLYISPNYLRQIFKQHTGESFVEYLTRIRMEKAAALMEDTTLKIQYIAQQVGYSNQRYFAICFKKHYQLTPTEYRELHYLKS